MSIKSLTEGSSIGLMTACRRLLLGIYQPAPEIDDVAAVRCAGAKISESGEVLLEEDEDDEDGENQDGGQEGKLVTRRKSASTTSSALSGSQLRTLKDPETVRWAVEGLAYLSMNAEVKEEIVGDPEFVRLLFQVASVSFLSVTRLPNDYLFLEFSGSFGRCA